MSLASSVLMALAMGLCVARLLPPHSWKGAGGLPLLLCLSLGLGLGISSLWFFLCLVIFGPHRSAFLAGEIGIMVVLALLLLVRRRSKPLVPVPAAAQLSWLWRIPGAAFLVALLTAVRAFTRYSTARPHGAWDAWGDWNLRARFLYLGGTHWTEVFSPRGTTPHRDYPLLLSATVARCWTYMQSDTQRAPILIAFLFTFAIAGELLFALSLLRSRSQGLIAATVLLATPFFLILGSARLCIQLYPSALFLLFLLARTPEEALNQAPR